MIVFVVSRNFWALLKMLTDLEIFNGFPGIFDILTPFEKKLEKVNTSVNLKAQSPSKLKRKNYH